MNPQVIERELQLIDVSAVRLAKDAIALIQD